MLRRMCTAILIACLSMMQLAALGAMRGASPVLAATANLIGNGSFEASGNSTTPDLWQTDHWGSNTATFSYLTSGYAGTHSVQIAMSSRTNGDAKWAHQQVATSGGADYTYRDATKATVPTELIVEYQLTNNTYTYQWLATVSASSAWQVNTVSFTTPQDAARLRVLHVLNRVGTLTLDDAFLATSSAPPVTMGVPNNSVEAPNPANPNQPQSWSTDQWGTIAATFSYPTTGQDGGRSVRVDVSSRSSGDAKWVYDAQPVTGGASYRFADYYQATAPTELVAKITLVNGTDQYQGLANLPAASTWTAASATLTTPTNAARITILHLINRVGSLTTDNYQLQPTTVATPTPTPTPSPTPTPTAPPTPTPVPTSVPTPTPTPTPAVNLIDNGSMETASGDVPTNWQTGRWGDNTASFTYLNGTAHTGNRSVQVAMQSYVDGDAKWYFNPVAVSSATTYTYTDAFIGTTSSEVVAAISLSTGGTQYLSLATPAAASAWTTTRAQFTTPANATQVTIYHLIHAVGSLTLDDVTLTKVATLPNPAGNITPNYSAEQGLDTPTDWQSGGWGNNTRVLTWATDTAYSGTHSLKVALTSYTDGDAKWTFAPQTVQSNTTYQFRDWYQANISSSVVLQVILTDGSSIYPTLGTVAPSETWASTTFAFTTPANTQSITVFHLINQVGWLTVDDITVTPYQPTPLPEGMVSYTFDDGFANIYTNALPLLEQYNIKSTQYIITGDLNTPDYMSDAMVRDFYAKGHEIGSHTVTHPHLPQLTLTQLDSELSQSKNYLTNLLGVAPTDFASPYGEYNQTVLQEIQQYYATHRSVDEGYNSPDLFQTNNIHVQNVEVTTTVAQVEQWLDYAKTNRVWLVLVLHESVDNGGQYSWPPANLGAVLRYTQNSGLKTTTIVQGTAILQAAQ